MTRSTRTTQRAVKPSPVFQLIQIVAAPPGWHAIFEAGDRTTTVPLACFAIIEMREPGVAPVQVVRPFAVHDCGEIDDVAHRDGFVVLLPPCAHCTHTSSLEMHRTEDSRAEVSS